MLLWHYKLGKGKKHHLGVSFRKRERFALGLVRWTHATVVIHDCPMHPNTSFTENHLVDFLLVIGLLSLGVTAEAQRAIIDWKLAFWRRLVNLAQHIWWMGHPLLIIRELLDRPVNAVQFCRWKFSHKDILTFFHKKKSIFVRKTVNSPFGGLEATTYAVYLNLLVKLIVDFLFVLTEVVSKGLTVEALRLRLNIDRKSAFLKGDWSLWRKMSGRRERPLPTICARFDRPMNALQLCRWQFSHKNVCTHFLREKCSYIFQKR